MYGLVNKAMQNLITESFGQEVWDQIRVAAKVDIELFSSNEAYDDEVTYKLASAASEILLTPIGDLLFKFGIYWATRTAPESYGAIMRSTGATLPDFLTNLPKLHTHVKIIFPELRPPTFLVENVTESTLDLHYHTFRPGLQKFVEGVIQGLGEMFSTDVCVNHIKCKKEPSDYDVFHISWSIKS